jgi:hypothetical protein
MTAQVETGISSSLTIRSMIAGARIFRKGSHAKRETHNGAGYKWLTLQPIKTGVITQAGG